MLVVGDLMLDRYISGRVRRISPEAPVPVVRVEDDWSGLGGAANVAANVVALGARCSVVGCVGDDEAGRELRDALHESGIGIDGVLEVKGASHDRQDACHGASPTDCFALIVRTPVTSMAR